MTYERNWETEGAVVMHDAKTIDRYRELRSQHPDCYECGCFWAFSDKQFAEGYAILVKRGHIKDGDKLVRTNATGLFGTREGINRMHEFYYDIKQKIKIECVPQEVYFEEYNNHECMIAWDGDEEAIKIIVDIWGKEIAKSLIRFNASVDIDNIS